MVLAFTSRKEFDKKTDSIIKEFFVETNKALAMALLNPLYRLRDEIRSPIFNERVLNLGKEYLRPFFDKKK